MMKVIGVTGGIGCGKSTVLAALDKRSRVTVCEADLVARELQDPGQACYEAIVAHYGRRILNADQTLNRKAIAQIVFGNEEELQTMNAIMMPVVRKEVENRILQEAEKGTKVFFIEAALLIEEHYDEICDELWYIYTDVETRIRRLKASREYSDALLEEIMQAQLPEEVFRQICKRTIDNSGTFERTCAQLNIIMNELEEN